MSIFWSNDGSGWIKKRNAWMEANGYPTQSNTYFDSIFTANSQADIDNALAADKRYTEGEKAFLATLSPAEAADLNSQFAKRQDSFDKSWKIGKGAALGIIGAAAGGAGLQALGGAGLSGGAGTAAAVPAEALSAGSGLSGAGNITAGSTLLGGAAPAAAGGSGGLISPADAGTYYNLPGGVSTEPVGSLSGLGDMSGYILPGVSDATAQGAGFGLGGGSAGAGTLSPLLSQLGNAAPTAAAAAPAAAPSGGGLLSSAGSAVGGVADWISKNPGLASLLGGALATAGSSAGSSGGGSSQAFAPQPGLKMGSMTQQPMNQNFGTLTPMGQKPGLMNSGLSRFGAQGGLFTPSAYTPQNYRWGGI